MPICATGLLEIERRSRHEQAEIEAAGVNQQSLPNGGVATAVHATKAADLIEMGEGPFEALAAEP
jgi:hypothetical protein